MKYVMTILFFFTVYSTNAVNISLDLFYAVEMNDPELVLLLLKSGANINVKDYNKDTVLSWVVENGHLEIIRYLVSNNINFTVKNKMGYTALTYLSPYHYFTSAEIIKTGGYEPRFIVLSLVLIGFILGISYLIFRKKDIIIVS